MGKKNEKLKLFFRYFWIFLIGSIVGFLYENILVLFQKGHFELRQGLLYGPLIPVYGAGAVVYEIVVPKIKSPLKVFLYTIFFGGVVEYVFSYLQEVLFGTISWNYEWLRINFNGRTSLLHAFYWGLAGLIFYEIIHPWFDKVMNVEITSRIKTITTVLIIFVAFDILISWTASMRQTQRLLNVPPETKFDRFLDKYYPDERIDKIYTNKIITMNKNM